MQGAHHDARLLLLLLTSACFPCGTAELFVMFGSIPKDAIC